MTSTDASNAVEIKKAGPPFDDPEADVIIRSFDNIDFYVFKTLLSFSSSVFKDMFHVAQGKPGDDELNDGLQVIHTDDSAETWRIFFRFVYPCCTAGPPMLKSLDEFSRVWEFSRKYGITGAEKMIAAELIAPRFLEMNPMRVFALACQHGLELEARVAAKQTLHLPILGRPHVAELENMTASNHHRLQEYHLRCGAVASKVARDTKWIKNDAFIWFAGHSICREEYRYRKLAGGADYLVAVWWDDYMQSAAKALEHCPVGATVLGSELTDDALRNASLCPQCSPHAFPEMREFGEMFAAEVDRVVEKVFTFIFPSSHVLTMSVY
jgi:hypothetical protein